MSPNTRLASSRDQTCLVKGLSRAMISRIFFSMAGKILRRERLVAEEVVVEAVVDHRADGDLRARPQRLHGFRQHMRGVMANEFQRARVVAGEEFDFGVVVDRVGQIGEPAVERHRHRAFGERRRNALGDVEAGDAVVDSPDSRRRERSARPFIHSCCSLAAYQCSVSVDRNNLSFRPDRLPYPKWQARPAGWR